MTHAVKLFCIILDSFPLHPGTNGNLYISFYRAENELGISYIKFYSIVLAGVQSLHPGFLILSNQYSVHLQSRLKVKQKSCMVQPS